MIEKINDNIPLALVTAKINEIINTVNRLTEWHKLQAKYIEESMAAIQGKLK